MLFLHDHAVIHEELRRSLSCARNNFSRLRNNAAITGDVNTVRWCIEVEETNMNCVRIHHVTLRVNKTNNFKVRFIYISKTCPMLLVNLVVVFN